MKKTFLVIIIFSLVISLISCQGVKKDMNGVPIVTDVTNIKDEDGSTMSAQEFLDKWCPGNNKTPIFNPTCILVKTQRDKEKSTDMYKNNTIQKW